MSGAKKRAGVVLKHHPATKAELGVSFVPGMSLRDWFAGQAITGLVVNPQGDWIDIAMSAYDCADALMRVKDHDQH